MLRTLDSSRLWPSTRYAVEFQLLTGARPGEVRLATRSEIDLEARTWTLPSERVKSDRAFQVHLSPRAIEIVRVAFELPRESGDYLFPGYEGAALEKMAVARALRRLAPRVTQKGGKALRPHDLRKTFRTMLSRLGVQPHIAELCLNHLETETMRRVYDGYDYGAEMADAWERVSSHITALRSGGAQVISIRATATEIPAKIA
ncbi:MAG: site-specific integrase [Betaproteobacteria bacterium]|nr:site-specific integrase [Betaproteobacteria bacterium]